MEKNHFFCYNHLLIGGNNMTKIAAIVNNVQQAQNIQNYIDTYLLPIKDFSINYTNSFTLDEINKLKSLNKEIFVIVNKNIHNTELENLIKLLKQIEKLSIQGIIFYDIAIVNLKHKLNLKTPLVWAQEHLTTNYGTINYWYDKGATYTYLSSELTKREIDEITNHTKAKLFLTIFGYIPMFTSRRHLVQNYLDTFKLQSNSHIHQIQKEGKSYIISDTKFGTTVYSNYILNATNESFPNIDYLVFNSNLIDEQQFLTVLKDYQNKHENSFPKETGFLYQETIYKVK